MYDNDFREKAHLPFNVGQYVMITSSYCKNLYGGFKIISARADSDFMVSLIIFKEAGANNVTL